MRKYNRINKIFGKDFRKTLAEIRKNPEYFGVLERGSARETVFAVYIAVAIQLFGELRNWSFSKNGGLWVAIQIPAYESWGLTYYDESWWVNHELFKIAREKSLAVLYREVRMDLLTSWYEGKRRHEECPLLF